MKRDEVLDHVSLVRLGEGILTSAEAITEHVKTLDAIHLASTVATGADTVVVTHDVTLKTVAVNLGFATLDPVGA